MGLLPIYYVYHYLEKTEKWGILGKDSAASENELKRKMQAGEMFISVKQNCKIISYFFTYNVYQGFLLYFFISILFCICTSFHITVKKYLMIIFI